MGHGESSCDPVAIAPGRPEEAPTARPVDLGAGGVGAAACIVLLAAEEISNTEIAQRVETTRTTVIAWQVRYEQAGVEGLVDHDRLGQRRQIDHRAIIVATSCDRPEHITGGPVGGHPARSVLACPTQQPGGTARTLAGSPRKIHSSCSILTALECMSVLLSLDCGC